MTIKNNNTLQCTLDRFENGHAVLDFGTYGTLTVAKRYVPKDCKEGEAFLVEFLTSQAATRRRENLARAMLEEILNGK